jgi:uncharacterized protein (DUF1330 family)
MRTYLTVAASVAVGMAIGGFAVQGLQAQAKPKAYLVTESQILDAAAAQASAQQIQSVIQAAGGRTVVSTRGKITAVVGPAPVRFGVSEWENIDKAQAYMNSPERKALEPAREKGVKTVRQFIVEQPN